MPSTNPERSRKTRRAPRTLERVPDHLQAEVLSVAAKLFCRHGHKAAELLKTFRAHFQTEANKTKLPHLAFIRTPHQVMDLVREAAERQTLCYLPVHNEALGRSLQTEFGGVEVRVADSTEAEGLAAFAAKYLLSLIQGRNSAEVHVGFAGGMTLKNVAGALAPLLRLPHRNNPKKLFFYCMTGGLVHEGDFFDSDANSFMSVLVGFDAPIKVVCFPMCIPGLLPAELFAKMNELAFIRKQYERKLQLDIVVTSGSLLEDPNGTIRRALEMVLPDRAASDAALEALRARGVVGDLLWHPFNVQGPIAIAEGYRIATLMGLHELPTLLARGGRVVGVFGRSGRTSLDKTDLAHTLLSLRPGVVSDVVLDLPTALGLQTQVAAGLLAGARLAEPGDSGTAANAP